jgi:hypothetical protein
VCERVAADKKFQRKSFRVEKKKSRKAQENNFYPYFLYQGFRELIIFCLFVYLCVVIKITCFICRQVLSNLFSMGLRNGLHNYEDEKTISGSLKGKEVTIL